MARWHPTVGRAGRGASLIELGYCGVDDHVIGGNCRRSADGLADHPAGLADPPGPLEPMAFEQRERAVVQERARHLCTEAERPPEGERRARLRWPLILDRPLPGPHAGVATRPRTSTATVNSSGSTPARLCAGINTTVGLTSTLPRTMTVSPARFTRIPDLTMSRRLMERPTNTRPSSAAEAPSWPNANCPDGSVSARTWDRVGAPPMSHTDEEPA